MIMQRVTTAWDHATVLRLNTDLMQTVPLQTCVIEGWPERSHLNDHTPDLLL